MTDYGIRKNNSLKALHKLNDKYDLGLKNLEDLSTSQLKRKLFEIRKEKGLTINKTTRLLTKVMESN